MLLNNSNSKQDQIILVEKSLLLNLTHTFDKLCHEKKVWS